MGVSHDIKMGVGNDSFNIEDILNIILDCIKMYPDMTDQEYWKIYDAAQHNPAMMTQTIITYDEFVRYVDLLYARGIVHESDPSDSDD
jgi:hypothetical protein